jgi:hypothetical protein
MPTSDPQGVHLGGGNYAAWNGQRVTLSAVQGDTETWHSVILEPEELGRFMDWLHDIIQANPEATVFTRSDAP